MQHRNNNPVLYIPNTLREQAYGTLGPVFPRSPGSPGGPSSPSLPGIPADPLNPGKPGKPAAPCHCTRSENSLYKKDTFYSQFSPHLTEKYNCDELHAILMLFNKPFPLSLLDDHQHRWCLLVLYHPKIIKIVRLHIFSWERERGKYVHTWMFTLRPVSPFSPGMPAVPGIPISPCF